MKKALVFTTLVLWGLLGMGQAGDSLTTPANISPALKLQVYYFHLTQRCHTCTNIEAELRKLIEGTFKAELERGIIRLASIDCELPENETLSKQYDAYGATLALTSYKDGKEHKKTDLTNWAFSNISKPEKYRQELEKKIRELIK